MGLCKAYLGVHVQILGLPLLLTPFVAPVISRHCEDGFVHSCSIIQDTIEDSLDEYPYQLFGSVNYLRAAEDVHVPFLHVATDRGGSFRCPLPPAVKDSHTHNNDLHRKWFWPLFLDQSKLLIM